MRKFETDVYANWANPDIKEEEADAILLDIYHVNKYGDVQQVSTGISPTEARKLAAALNREADAFDEREQARQEAKEIATALRALAEGDTNA